MGKKEDYYLKKGYNLEWIESRIKSIINRKNLGKQIVTENNAFNYKYRDDNKLIEN